MFGIGTTEVILILVIALLVIGPSKLPDVARALGKGMAEFKKMSSDVKKTIDWESQLEDLEDEAPENENLAKEEEAKEQAHKADSADDYLKSSVDADTGVAERKKHKDQDKEVADFSGNNQEEEEEATFSEEKEKRSSSHE